MGTLFVDRLIDVGRDDRAKRIDLGSRRELHPFVSVRIRSLRVQNVGAVVEQHALEEHQGKVVGELLEEDDVDVLIDAVARLSPLDLLGESARQQDRTNRSDLVRPLVALGEVGVNVWVVLHQR